MSETMTLEELRSLVRQSPVAGVDVGALEVGIDAAIRGRDALRHAIAVEVDIGKIADTLHAERDKHRARAEKAEAELAALRKRINEAPRVEVLCGTRLANPAVHGATSVTPGTRAALVVLGDDDG